MHTQGLSACTRASRQPRASLYTSPQHRNIIVGSLEHIKDRMRRKRPSNLQCTRACAPCSQGTCACKAHATGNVGPIASTCCRRRRSPGFTHNLLQAGSACLTALLTDTWSLPRHEIVTQQTKHVVQLKHTSQDAHTHTMEKCRGRNKPATCALVCWLLGVCS